MHIQVQGKQVQLGEALTGHVTRQIEASAYKYFDQPVRATVTFSRDGGNFCCDAMIHLPTGLTATAQGRAGDCYAAFGQGAERLDKQLRRHKRRLRDHHPGPRKQIEDGDASAYVGGAIDSPERTAVTDGP